MDRFFKSLKDGRVYTLDTILEPATVRVKNIDGVPQYFDLTDFRNFVEVTDKVKEFLTKLEVK